MAIYEKTGLTLVPDQSGREIQITIDDRKDHISFTLGSLSTAILTAAQARYLAGRLSAAASRLEKRQETPEIVRK